MEEKGREVETRNMDSSCMSFHQSTEKQNSEHAETNIETHLELIILTTLCSS